MPDDFERISSRYMHVWGWITIVLLIGISLFFTFSGKLFRIESGTSSYLAAVGGSLLASVVLYVLVSLFLDPKLRRLEALRISNFAIEAANRQFQSRFQVSLPEAVYGDSELPRTEFSKAFASLLRKSSRYDLKGASAVFTVFRLDSLKWRPEIQRLEEVRLRLVDPTDEAMIRAHARVMWAEQRDSTKPMEKIVHDLKLDIAVSLISLFDIRAERPSVVYLHRDLPLFRCEMFDDGMFLSYYSFNPGRSAYPEALQFSPQTRPYQAYRQGLELTRSCSSCVLSFTDDGPSADIINSVDKLKLWLDRLDLRWDIDTLRSHRQDRFEVLRSRLGKEGLSRSDLF